MPRLIGHQMEGHLAELLRQLLTPVRVRVEWL